MQFVTNGPDIPEALLEAHEEGRVVFFCGAGISYHAGLPGFKGLVDKIYDTVGDVRNEIEQEAYDRNQFDATLDLLEGRLSGQRIAVRRALEKVLKPNLRPKGATDTHAALLQLSRCHKDGAYRLVTTNFDRVFESVAKRTKQSLNAYAAPMLPIPKSSRWNGIVYLHGLLPQKSDENALNRLVLTSGDFGLAYLIERWAARFVSELFRNYIVCFVGYSINDPVLRYMMDAMAADRMMGEVTPQAYALADCEPGQEHVKTVEWKAKGVTPILYEVPSASYEWKSKGITPITYGVSSKKYDHSALHKTLKAWAETYRDGILGKERIVLEYALARPSASTRQDDFVGRMLWALSGKSGLPAKRFAECNPVPSLEWLTALSELRYQRKDLNRFGVVPSSEENEKIRFSFLDRPAPYKYAPRMSLVSVFISGGYWDNLMYNLARWLLRHLNDPALIIWVSQRGGQLHQDFSRLLDLKLSEIAKFEYEKNKAALDEIRSQAPNALPSPPMRKLWRLLLAGKFRGYPLDFYSWAQRLNSDSFNSALRFELRKILAPMVVLNNHFVPPALNSTIDEPTRIDQLVRWELVLAADHVYSSLSELDTEAWRKALPLLLEDFQQLLRDALDLRREMGGADEQRDLSYGYLPSISPHSQNQGFQDWVVLIEFLRDSWLEVKEINPARAKRVALDWFEIPYPTFKRLALFAASLDGVIDPTQWAEWLTSNDGVWLWSVETRRETIRLLVLQGANLPSESLDKLEKIILCGPPREKYFEDLTIHDWNGIKDRSVWLLLAKMRLGGSKLSAFGLKRLEALSNNYPTLQLADNQSDEFSVWVGGIDDDDDSDWGVEKSIDIAHLKTTKLIAWLKKPRSSSILTPKDNWRECCARNFFRSICALHVLSKEQTWPAERWGEALNAWSEGHVVRYWRYVAPLLLKMPDQTKREILPSFTRWLEICSNSINRHETIMFSFCQWVLRLEQETSTGMWVNNKPNHEPVREAINHPIGHITQVLLNIWINRQHNDNDGLPSDVEPLFTQICDLNVERFQHGRVLLASRLIALFRVDRHWTEKYLLPSFNWGANPVEARRVWIGFMWSPRLYGPLLKAFKDNFLATAAHSIELGEASSKFAAFFTYVALGKFDGYTYGDFQTAIKTFSPEQLQNVVQTLLRALDAAGEQSGEYWENRIFPFWEHVWPKSRELNSDNISKLLARLIIASENKFPIALEAMESWLQPFDQPMSVIKQLFESGICMRFPSEALKILDAILKDQPWLPSELRQCLGAIINAKPELLEEHRYRRLDELARTKGM